MTKSSTRPTGPARFRAKRWLWCELLFVATAVAFSQQTIAVAQSRDPFGAARRRMVQEEIVEAGVSNERVIEAMNTVPRHQFVARRQWPLAYFDMALPIGHAQTISPPFVVAYMTEQLDPQPEDRVLEIGTGSGYQAAVLAELVREVYTIEIVEPLARQAARTLDRLGYRNVFVAAGDGYKGWPEHAPFDKIVVTCSPDDVPRPLVEQLKNGGRMIIPVGSRYQQVLVLLEKRGGELIETALRPTLFVPMTGDAEQRRRDRPDPTMPEIVNGGFEEINAEAMQPAGWHYQRQLELDTEGGPEGTYFVTFRNREPGRFSQALQGFAVDGRKVRTLDVSAWIRIDDVRAGPKNELPAVAIDFYDEQRRSAGTAGIGPWRGTLPWTEVTDSVQVPIKAREAVLRIGLFGATGEASFDAVEIKPNPRGR